MLYHVLFELPVLYSCLLININYHYSLYSISPVHSTSCKTLTSWIRFESAALELKELPAKQGGVLNISRRMVS